jgi:outer membrane protein OmpU
MAEPPLVHHDIKNHRAGIVLLAMIAAALPPVQAGAAERISLQLGGYSKWWLVGQWSDGAYESAVGSAYSNTDVKGDNEVHFLGSTTLDNGLTIGIKTELEGGGHTTQTTDTIDKAFVWVQGGFGKLELGSDYNAASLLHVSAPEAAGLWNGPPLGLMSDMAVPRPSAVSTMYSGNQTELDHDDNAEKILYFSPSFHGFTLGLSYTPCALSEDDRAPPRRSQTYAAGLAYGGSVGAVAVGLSAGYLGGQLNSTNATDESVQAWSLGGQLSYEGVSVGGSYGSERHGYRPGALAAGTIDQTGRSWDMGLMYETGPAKISLDYYQSRVQGLASNPGSDRITVYQLSGEYMLGTGVAIMGAAGHITYDDESTAGNPGNHNQGFSLTTGLGLWF